MTQLYQSKIFANGSTTLPKPVRDALGIKAGDRVRYVISEKGVRFFKYLRRTHNRMILICARLWTLPKRSWMKTMRSCESLNEFRSSKCGSEEIKQCQLVIRPDVGVLWVGEVLTYYKKEELRQNL